MLGAMVTLLGLECFCLQGTDRLVNGIHAWGSGKDGMVLMLHGGWVANIA